MIFKKIIKSRLTKSIARNIIKLVNALRIIRLRGLRTPEEVVLFITSRCMMQCPFCFYAKKINLPEREMSLEEMELLARSLRCNNRLLLTGGEPFLRQDIDKICEIFLKHSKPRFISIPTNGFMPDLIQEKTAKILDNKRLRNLKISVSIDALGEKHDQLRCAPDAFVNAVKTLKLLLDLRGKKRNLFLEIAVVVNSRFLEEVEEFIAYFQEFKIPIKFSIMRDRDNSFFGIKQEIALDLFAESNMGSPDLVELNRINKKLSRINQNASYKFWSYFQELKFKSSINIVQEKKRIFPCYAGRADAIIYANGDMAFCENTRVFSNLRDHKFDFNKIWRGEEAKAMRKEIEHCACINGCNMVTSMLYDTNTLLRVFEQSLIDNFSEV